MNIYLISQGVNNGYDTYDSAVVAAETTDDAKRIHPSIQDDKWWEESSIWQNWASHPDEVDAELIGTTDQSVGLILASFNAG